MDDFFINPNRLRVLGTQMMDLLGVNAGSGLTSEVLASLEARAASAFEFEIVNGTAVIGVRGSLVSSQIGGWYWYGGLTYESLLATIEQAVGNHEVERILLSFNTPGGTVTGCAEAAARLDALSELKPIWAFCSMADSAGYWLASATNRIIVDPTGEVGSIGVITTHMDMSKALEEYGLKVTHIFSGAHKADGSPYEALSDDAKARIQADLDHLRGIFVDSVASYRQMPSDALLKTEALTYIGSKAVDAGLADETGFFSDVLKTMSARERSEITSTNALTQEKSPMAKKLTESKVNPKASEDEEDKKKAAESDTDDEGEDDKEKTKSKAEDGDADKKDASAEAVASDRARVSGILGHSEAAGREKMAQHLALSTSMSVEDAGKLLAAAPKAEQKAPDRLDNAMSKLGNPNLGADGLPEKGNAVISDMQRRFPSAQ